MQPCGIDDRVFRGLSFRVSKQTIHEPMKGAETPALEPDRLAPNKQAAHARAARLFQSL
jgi:hypothetical protein